jgi:hypothetical protein
LIKEEISTRVRIQTIGWTLTIITTLIIIHTFFNVLIAEFVLGEIGIYYLESSEILNEILGAQGVEVKSHRIRLYSILCLSIFGLVAGIGLIRKRKWSLLLFNIFAVIIIVLAFTGLGLLCSTFYLNIALSLKTLGGTIAILKTGVFTTTFILGIILSTLTIRFLNSNSVVNIFKTDANTT